MKKSSRILKGFTLVELMIATLILTGTLMGMVRLFVHCTLLAELSKEKTIAMSVAQGKMEDIWNSDYDMIVTNYASKCLCNDSLDNDADGASDLSDSGCNPNSVEGSLNVDTGEKFECSDGIDNDKDGKIDYGSGVNNDSDCASNDDHDEGYVPSVAAGDCSTDPANDLVLFDVPSTLRGGAGIVNIDASNPELKEVQVIVSWNSRDGRSQSVTLMSMLSKR